MYKLQSMLYYNTAVDRFGDFKLGMVS